MSDGQQNIQPRRRKKGPVKKPPDRPVPLPDGDGCRSPLLPANG